MKIRIKSRQVLFLIKIKGSMFMWQLLVIMSLTFKVYKVSLIFTIIFTINNIFVIVLVIGGVMEVYRFH